LWLNILIIFTSLGVSGCGFQPLYAPTNQAREKLSHIKIKQIPDRMGQVLRNHLLDTLTPYGEPKNPEYILKITVDEQRIDLGFRKDATARRAQLQYTADVILLHATSHEVILSDKLDLMAGFSIGSQADFSSIPALVSEEKARLRAMEILAQDIKSLLASYLSIKD
jgi:LPS-assembly lipoprotein